MNKNRFDSFLNWMDYGNGKLVVGSLLMAPILLIGIGLLVAWAIADIASFGLVMGLVLIVVMFGIGLGLILD